VIKLPGRIARNAHLSLIVILGLLAYSNTFNASFQYDDFHTIVDNSLVRDLGSFLDPSGIREHFISAVGADDPTGTLYPHFRNRAIGYLSFALNYFAHGPDVRGYHAVNLAIHIMNALLVYALVSVTFRAPRLKGTALAGHAKHIALLSALFFVSHPLQTQSVTYIYQRFASMATMFYLASLLAYAQARLSETRKTRRALIVLCVISALLAMKTKEIAVTLPLAAVLYEVLFLDASVTRRLRSLAPLLLTLLVIPIEVLVEGKPVGELLSDADDMARAHTDVPRAAYLFTQFRVIVTYLRLLFLPVNQSLEYDYPVYGAFLAPQVLVSFLLLSALLCLGVWMLFRSRSSEPALRLVSFGIFWFFLTLSVESSVIPINGLIYEHRAYLPSVGAFAALATGLSIILVKLKSERARSTAVLLMAIMLLTLGSAANARNRVWQTQVTLWSDIVQKSPRRAIAHTNLANAYMNEGKFDKALRHLEHSVGLYPFFAEPYFSLGICCWAEGRYGKAIEHYLSAERLKRVRSNTPGEAAGTAELIACAIECFQDSLGFDPGTAKMQRAAGVAYMSQGHHEKAIGHFREALRLKPDFPEAFNSLGGVCLDLGRTDDAIEHYLDAIRLEPDYSLARNNLGVAYLRKGLVDNAMEEFMVSIELDPGFPEARINLGTAFEIKNLPHEAYSAYKKALALDPGSEAAKEKLRGLGFSVP
jgi:tetratricopeptide (TPR) repeat protein